MDDAREALHEHERECWARHAETLARLSVVEARQKIILWVMSVGFTAIISLEIERWIG